MHNFVSSNCKYNYQVSDEQYYDRDNKILCPECHSKYKMQTIELSDNMGLNMRDSFSISSTDIRTDRITLDENDDNPTNRIKIVKIIEEFIHTGNDTQLTEHFEPLVKEFTHHWENKIICYRGVNKNLSYTFKNKQISPTPKEYVANNRYSQKNEMAFYLIDKPKYIKNEIGIDEWIEQKYILNPKYHKLKLAYVTSTNKELHNDLAHIFKISESGKFSTGINFENILKEKSANKYLISQFIANLFKQYEWDGLVIPGIHGNSKEVYNNIVIFEHALDSWQSWCDGEFYDIIMEMKSQ
jgi:uncharacterized Zn ribbon protein